MTDPYGREINYIRVSVTDRCNERCAYCMPSDGVEPVFHHDILTFEEIIRIVRVCASLGIGNVRLTGGEPLVRSGLTDLVRGISSVDGIESISLTTNGTLLGGAADELIEAGVRAFNISLDTADPELYRTVTRGGCLRDALAGIEAVSGRSGVSVKIDTVLLGVKEQDITETALAAERFGAHIRFIEMMPVGCGKRWFSEEIDALGLTGGGTRYAREAEEIMQDRFGSGAPADMKKAGHGPAKYVQYEGLRIMTGYIPALTRPFCEGCNRIRLTSDGLIKPCLESADAVDLRALIRGGASDEEIASAVVQALSLKPAHHLFGEATGCGSSREGSREMRPMSSIGG